MSSPLDFINATPLGYFASLVQDDEAFPLLEAATAIAQDEYPNLDVQEVLGDVDQLLARLRRRCADHVEPLERLRTLNQFFFNDLGFGGNVNNYYDPDNSHINVLLRTRRGIPISLAVVWLELAQGLGLKAKGVGFPGHFMVKVNLPQGQVVIDPFTGQSLSREDLSERAEPFKPSSGELDDLDAPVGRYLRAAPPRDIVVRMLRNLKEIHHSQRDWLRLIAVLDRLLIVLPEAWMEYRDRGLAWAEMGDARLALIDLETYLQNETMAADRGELEEQVEPLRREIG